MSPLFEGNEKNKWIEKCDALYAWHKDVIYRMALDAVGGDRSWALDLLEKCMMVAWEHIEIFEDERSDKSGAILTAILQGLIGEIYLEAWQKMGILDQNTDVKAFVNKKDQFDVDQILRRNELTADLAKYVDKLTNADKELIFARFFMGFSEAQIAVRDGSSSEETRNKIFLVKQKIAKMMKEW